MVHRGKGIPTLSSVADEKSIARAEAAGRPSNWEEQRRSSYAGRRSRRNSITDDSQLTIENFGGSQVIRERERCERVAFLIRRYSRCRRESDKRKRGFVLRDKRCMIE